MPDTVGFIGLGVMGKPMAKHVQAKGYPLVVVESQPAAGGRAGLARRACRLLARGRRARLDSSSSRCCRTRRTSSACSKGPDGVIAGLQRGAIVIDMSSISPVATRRLAAKVAEAGGTMLDAPVSGGEIGAINAQLSIMVGGDAAAFAKARPVLACMGHPERIVHVGAEPGSGQICKVCNQMAIGGALAGVSEAMALARKAGVDPALVRQALLGGFASSRVLEVHGERMLKKNYVPGFRTRLYQKDLRIAHETAASLGVAVPATALVSQLINALVASGGADLDYSAMGTVLFDLAGLE